MRFVQLCISLSIMFYFVLCPTAWAAESTGIELVQLTTADGVKLTGVIRRPSSSRYQAGIVLIHGYSGNFYLVRFFNAKLATDPHRHAQTIFSADLAEKIFGVLSTP